MIYNLAIDSTVWQWLGEGWDAAVLFAVYYTTTGTYFELPLISYNVTTPRRETNHGLDRPVAVKNMENNGASFLIKKIQHALS